MNRVFSRLIRAWFDNARIIQERLNIAQTFRPEGLLHRPVAAILSNVAMRRMAGLEREGQKLTRKETQVFGYGKLFGFGVQMVDRGCTVTAED